MRQLQRPRLRSHLKLGRLEPAEPRNTFRANSHGPQGDSKTSTPLCDCDLSSKEKMPKYAWWSGYQMTLEDFIAFVGSIPGLDVDHDLGRDEFLSHFFAFCRWKRRLPAKEKKYAPPIRSEHSIARLLHNALLF